MVNWGHIRTSSKNNDKLIVELNHKANIGAYNSLVTCMSMDQTKHVSKTVITKNKK